MIITNSRYALVGYFITSYPTRAHGIIVIWMHLGGLLSSQEARVALGYRLVRLLRFFRAWHPPHAMVFTIC